MVAALVLVGLVLSAGLSRRSGGVGAAVLAATSVLWLIVNEPMEGPVLLTVLPGHGLTGADLAGLTGLGLAVLRGVALRRGTSGSTREGQWSIPRPRAVARYATNWRRVGPLDPDARASGSPERRGRSQRRR